MNADHIREARVVLPAADLDETIAFFRGELGFQIRVISPADAPRQAVLSGHGLQIELRRDYDGPPGLLRLACSPPPEGDPVRVAPNGTRIEWVDACPALVVPALQPSLVVTQAGEGSSVIGRAGMRYRDLLPGRQGGRFVASLIQIEEGGPVSDWVHYHRLCWQVLYCKAGWARLVYEDQGPPFVMAVGDCILQPPQIRHQVLESSPGLEVIELCCPAEHPTLADPSMALPNAARDPERRFSGQRFLHHQAAGAAWGWGGSTGYAVRDTGVSLASGGLCSVRVRRAHEPPVPIALEHQGELRFLFVLAGSAALEIEDGARYLLAEGASAAVPAGVRGQLVGGIDLELLEVSA